MGVLSMAKLIVDPDFPTVARLLDSLLKKRRMKKAIIGLLWVVMACQGTKGELVTPDLLARTWLQQSVDGTTLQYPIQVEFTRLGTLLYGTEKRSGGCCAPSRFRTINAQIEFLGDESPTPQCATVSCSIHPFLTGTLWKIDELTATQLVLKAGNQTLRFR